MAPDAFVVNVTPEVAVVLGVGNSDFLARLLNSGASQVQFGYVSIKQFDVAEDPISVDSDATNCGTVAVSRLQRSYGPSHSSDEVVQFGEFSSGIQTDLLGRRCDGSQYAPDTTHGAALM